jgi:sodium/bile acid cotransporter 7
MLRRLPGLTDPFVVALMATVLIASLLPARGGWAPFFGGLADAGIVLLFFLHGAKLSREAIIASVRNWQLHLAVLAATFLLFPLLGLGMAGLPFVDPSIAAGLLFLTLIPSTVQSSIAFTSIAGGNVAAAVCSASFSNLAGVFLTPALVALLMNRATGGLTFSSVEQIVLQLLVPFLLGHALRPLIGGFVTRQKRLVSLVDRGSILLVVYTAFGAAVIEGLWHKVSLSDLMLIMLLSTVLLAIVLAATWGAGRLFGFKREDAIVLLFCGSKKSLASGVPMAGVLFPPAQIGLIILPLMLFHQIQLIACAIIARRLGEQHAEIEAGKG